MPVTRATRLAARDTSVMWPSGRSSWGARLSGDGGGPNRRRLRRGAKQIESAGKIFWISSTTFLSH